ncbi:MAG: universal stress protein [Acidimicrobiales bacterium]|nr:universal stress protein [Acidimicrobiales bacterium]
MARIVVGVDGSPGGDAALGWALDEAAARGATLQLVLAWTYPYVATVPGVTAPVFAIDDVESDAAALLDLTIERVTDGHPPDVTIERLVQPGPPARALLDVAEGADLLVVGTRGHGGFVGLLLGSVSEQCAHHAPCPVVIVPPRPERTDG